MFKRKICQVLAIVLVVAFVAACHPPGTLKPVSEMTPKEKATFFMNVYNTQAEDYKVMVAKPNLTEEQKKILNVKHQTLTQVYPLIQTYIAYVDAGAVPSPEVEASIIDLINQLTSAALSAVQ